MSLSPKVKNILIIAYVLFVVFAVFYINSITKYTKIEQVTGTKDSDSIKSKEAKVTLTVNNSKTYSVMLQTTDSVATLLEQLRKDEAFTYEKINYTYGTEIDNVNGQNAPAGYKWKILVDGKDITFNIADIDLVDQKNYELNLVKQ